MARETTTLAVTFLFPNLSDKPRKDLSSKLAWSVRCEFDKELLPTVKALGIHIKKEVDDNTDAVTYSFTAKQNYLNPKTGEPFRKPNILNAKNKILKGELIGNGSTGLIKISTFEYNFEGKKGIAATLEAMKVINLVEYVREEDPDFAVNEDDDDDFPEDNGDY
jgi:hypothetical protein